MDVQYNGETESVSYFSSETNTTSSLQSYGYSRLPSIVMCMRKCKWQKIILATSLAFSTSAFLLGILNHIQPPSPRKVPLSDRGKEAEYTVFYDLATTAPSHEGSGYSGNGMTTSVPRSVADIVMENVRWEIRMRENAMIQKFLHYAQYNNEINEDYQRNITKEVNLLEQARNETLSLLDGLTTVVRGLINDTVKFEVVEDFFATTQRHFDVLREVILHLRLQILQKNSKIIQSCVNCTTRCGSIKEDLGAVQGEVARHDEEISTIKHNITRLKLITSNSEQSFKTQMVSVSRKAENLVTRLMKNAAGLQVMSQRFGDLALSLRKQLADVNVTNTAKTQQAANSMQRSVSALFSKISGQIATLKTQTTNDIRRIERKIRSVESKIAQTDGKSAILSSINASLLSLQNALKGKSDRGWITAANGYEYLVTSEVFSTWSVAKEKCAQLGSKLAHVGIRNKNMDKFIFENLVEPCGHNAWIGLSDSGREGAWKWMDGQPISSFATNWANGQPNNIKRDDADQDCGEIDLQDGQWNDIWCSRRSSSTHNVALCERKV